MRPIELDGIRVELIWFDSLGAKSSSLFLETPEVGLLLDPGAAEMQPGYPLDMARKKELRQEALRAIKETAGKADIVFISHYHYDHHTLPQEAMEIYQGKRLWIKDPNCWINRSQWARARLFLKQLHEVSGSGGPEYLSPPESLDFFDPLEELSLARNKDFGDYRERREEILRKGRAWLHDLFRLWKKEPWVAQHSIGSQEVVFADGREFEFGETKVKITPPLFHGAEYDRVGWVIGIVVERRGKKVVYASDLQGPIIEDYAHWLIQEDPDLLILDGPPTYLLGYMLNLTNLNRAIDNLCAILRNTNRGLIIYDHHPLREARYRERLDRVYRMAEAEGRLFTAAEWLGEEPLVLKCASTAPHR